MPPTQKIHCQMPENFEMAMNESTFTRNGHEPACDSDRVVISGVSGLYPESTNLKEFSDILYNKINPVSDGAARWTFDHPELARYVGKAPDLNTFDAQFFKVYRRLGNNMDSISRKMLEHTYQAIYDAGINPSSLNGKNIAVFTGSCFSDTEKACFYIERSNGLPITGCNRSMFANRISYWLNLKGPSMAVDELCCSSTAAMKLACQAIRRGDCEAAIVAGGSLCLHPQSSVIFGRLIKYSKDGKTRSFDENASGCVKSEAINVMFLQKAKDALRIYADIVHINTEFNARQQEGTEFKFGFYRDPELMVSYMKKFYAEAKVSPHAVEYVEALGCADPDADKAELRAIEKVFCENRNDPLLVGSVMSNFGYLESASGIAAVTKVIFGYHTGILAGNLNCDSPRRDLPTLRDGRMQILTDNKPFSRGYVAVNGMSITGINSHVLLHSRYKPKDLKKYTSAIPYLVTLSGRQESSVWKIVENLKSHPLDPEEVGLLHSIHETSISGHLARGYIILDNQQNGASVNAKCLTNKVEYFQDVRPPLWFVYSGMGSQWAGMGADLMRIPTFAKAIMRCQEALRPKGVDVINIITSTDDKIFDNILNSFVGIAAVQIGLTDVLRDLGLEPDNIIGHSVGELGCAYADGCFTLEEMILAAYSRGLVSIQTPFIRGAMAAVGLGYQQVLEMCPPEIAIACHNGPDSCTISGPADQLRRFVAKLTEKNVFAREVPCSNIAYHSQYIAEAGPGLLKYLKEVIKSPKARSARWLSTSVPMDKWGEESAKYSSAEYHTNNLLNPVLFEETSSLVPAGAVLVEVAPHGLLQAILKRSLPASCKNVALTRRRHPDNARLVLETIGELYLNGYNPKLKTLYPPIEFPVSTGTPMLSHLVEWAHQEPWYLPLYVAANRKTTAITHNVISLHDEEHKYLRGNVLNGRMVYPFAAALVAVWDTLAMSQGESRRALPVRFSDVALHSQPSLLARRQLHLRVAICRGSGRFEVMDDYSIVASGVIAPNFEKRRNPLKEPDQQLKLHSTDIYKKLFLRDYSYWEDFRSIHSADASTTRALVKWCDNWVTLIDGMIQLNVLRQPHPTVSQPDYIKSIVINLYNHLDNRTVEDGVVVLPAEVSQESTRCGGVSISGIRFRNLPVISKPIDMVIGHLGPHSENSNMERNGDYMRLENTESILGDAVLRCTRTGDSNSLCWVQKTSSEKGVRVKVHYAGLNYLDSMKISGVIPVEYDGSKDPGGFGMSFSGITENGERVMGLVKGGALCTALRVPVGQLWPVPAHWSLQDAATVPLAYTLAYYCLCIKCSLMPGMSILIHGGAGSLGQAAISIALAHGCEVYTTVRDMRKKQFLLKMFPNLNEENIANSRDESFADMVLHKTGGIGVNVILCNLKGRLKMLSLRCCCKASSVVLDVVKIPTREKLNFGMDALWRTIKYIMVDLSSIFEDRNRAELKKVQLMVSDGVARGVVRPLSRVAAASRGVARAAALLAAGHNIGCVIVNTQHVESLVEKRLQVSPTAHQIIISDDDCVGKQFADLLTSRGARKIRLLRLNPTSDCHIISECEKNNRVEMDLVPLDGNKSLEVLTKGLGGVEGIYTMISNSSSYQNGVNVEKLIENLDTLSRKVWPDAKYFAVMNCGGDVGKATCYSRKRAGLPATIIQLPPVRKVDDVRTHLSQKCVNIRDALDAMERAICSEESFLRAKDQDRSPPSLLEQIAAVADIEIPKNVQDTTRLVDMKMAAAEAEAVRAFLRDHHNILLTNQEILELTTKRIRDLEAEILTDDIVQLSGLSTFFSRVDPDELTATSEMIFLPTLATGLNLKENEFDVSGTQLCILPGAEGHHGRFRTLCERLKLPALVLQPGLDHPHETLKDTAARYAKILMDKVEIKDNFYLLGYESGALVALEVAAILENNGLTGTVFYVAPAPDEIKETVKEHLKGLDTDESLQNAILKHMLGLMIHDEPDIDFQGTSWPEKVETIVRMSLGRVSHSAQYARKLIEAVYARINNLLRHEPDVKPLCSKLVLLWPKPAPSIANGVTASRSLQSAAQSLQKHSAQPVTAHALEAPLGAAIEDLRCAAIVNDNLTKHILDAFENKSLCETYVLDASAFMAVANS